jgi:hypothetical protein
MFWLDRTIVERHQTLLNDDNREKFEILVRNTIEHLINGVKSDVTCESDRLEEDSKI